MNRILLLIVLSTSLILGQFKNSAIEKKFEKGVLKEIKKVSVEKQKGKSNSEIKISVKNKYIAIDNDLRILCRVRISNSSARDKIISLGGKIKNESHNDIYVWIPFDKIENVAELNDVLSIGSKGVAVYRTEVISAGVGLHRTDSVYTAYGLTGSGIKVGVMSDGMNYWTASKDNGDLPTFVYAVDNTNNTANYPGSEGTAMMEIIHDIAPSAELWFGGIYGDDTPLDFANRVSHLKEQGCKVIVDDVGLAIGYSYFQENEISVAIRQFIQNNNGCYISAAGNENGQMYTGTNYTVAADSFINFVGSTNELIFTCNDTGMVRITLQWADDWYQPVEDYDLYVYDNNYQNILTSDNRSPNFPPEEYGLIHVATPGSTYKIKIKWFNHTLGLPNKEIKVAVWDSNINMPLASTEKEVFGHVITNEVIGVAATNVTDSLNVENFSSRGPAMVYSSGSGTVSSIQQPKITAADAVETFVGQSGYFGDPFSGTSAAAPHVAGIAALYFEMFPTDGYSNFTQSIIANSVAMNDGGHPSSWSKISGFGRVDAFNAIQYRYNQNFVTITINQKNSSGVNVDSAYIWQTNIWDHFQVPKPFVLQKSSTQYFKSKQTIIGGEKYHDWNSSLTDVTNHKNFTIPTQSGSYTANLFPTNNAQIVNSIEGISVNYGTIGFRDPWLIDTSDSKGPKNRGTVSLAKWYDNLTSPYSLSTSSAYFGIFKDQPIISGRPYYSVRAPLTQNIDLGGSLGTRDFYFQNWSGTGATFQNAYANETGVVFTSGNATVQANYKGHLLSSISAATSGNNQRKLAVSGSTKHLVYTSMGDIWYTRNTGSGWSNEMLVEGDAKNPSVHAIGSYVYIVWETDMGEGLRRISFKKSTNSGDTWGTTEWTVYTDDFDATPVVAGGSQIYNRIVVVWRESDGLYICKPEVSTTGSLIPNTTSQSELPSLAEDLNGYSLAYKNGSTIYHRGFTINSGTITYEGPITISPTGCTNPSVSRMWISQSVSNIAVAYERVVSGYGRIGFKNKNASGWQPVVEITANPNQLTQPSVCYDQASGKIHLFFNYNSSVAHSMRDINSGSWEPISVLGSGNAPQLPSYSNSGPVTALWTSGSNAPYSINISEIQTVSGPISSNTTWSGYVNVTGNVAVNAGATLEILPGTAIAFASGTSLIVNGILDATGTSDERITFTSAYSVKVQNGNSVFK
jgi:hypothetical protein